MDNQDVINFLNQVRKMLLDDKSWLESTIQPINEAFDMAISALKKQTLLSAQPERCEDCENFSKTRLLIPQPEIIRCKDCKHHHYDSKDIPYCDRIDYGYGWKDDDFCSRAERRTDELRSENSR